MAKIRGFLVLLGAVGGYGSWRLSQAARGYCGSRSAESPFDAELLFAPFLSVGAGILVAVVMRVPSRSDTWLWRLAPFALLTVLLALMCWVQMAWLGTPVGGTSDSGRCTITNVPDWWPVWLPVVSRRRQ